MTTLGGYGMMGGGGAPRNPQQLMAQKLMETTPAPVANSSQESAAANTLNQGLRGAMTPTWDSKSQSYKNPEWMDWLGKQFSSSTPTWDGNGAPPGGGTPTWDGFGGPLGSSSSTPTWDGFGVPPGSGGGTLY